MSDLYGNPKRAIAGQRHGLTGRTRTYSAGERIYPGDPLFGMVGDDEHCYRSHINAITLTADSALVIGNIIAVTINGISIPAIEFYDSSAETLARIVREIDLNPQLSEIGINAFIVEGANAFTIVGPGITITASAVVTGGASQPVFASAADTNLVFIGIAEHTELATKNGTGFYDVKDSVNVRDMGDIYAPVDEGSNPSDKEKAYIVLSTGVFTDLPASNYDCGCYFRSNKQDGLALIEVRGMK
jgi:hypothetical protein